jgi:O-antigen/teichoic acid export membrane protein
MSASTPSTRATAAFRPRRKPSPNSCRTGSLPSARHPERRAVGAYALGSLLLVAARQLFYVGPYEYLLKAKDSPGPGGQFAPALSPALAGACLGANMVQAGVLAAALVLAWLAARLVLAEPMVAEILGLLIPSLFTVALAAWYEAVLLRRVRVRRYYASTLAGDLAGALAAVLLLLRGWGVTALVAQAYVRNLVVIALYAGATGQRPSFGRWDEIAAVLRWSRARYLAVALTFTSTYGGDFVLGVSLSPAATGLFRAASRIVSALADLFSQPLQKIAQTNLSASHARGRDSGTTWLTMLSGVGAVAWAALVTLAVTAHDLVPLALGEKWAPAVPVVIVFCVIRGVSLLDAVTISVLVCRDRQRAMLKVQAITAAAVIVLALAAAPLGATGVAIGVGIAATGMSLAYAVMVMRLSRADGEALLGLARTAGPPVLAVAAALSLVAWARPDLTGAASILLQLSAAAVAFALAAFAVRHRLLAAIGSLGHLPAAGPPPEPYAAPAPIAREHAAPEPVLTR